jgi:hypothetical protein
MSVMKRNIEASTTARAPIDQARGIIRDDVGCILAERCSPEDRKERRFHTSLAVEAAGGGGLHQEVVVEAGRPTPAETGVVLPVRWRAAGHERLLPTFDGALELQEDGLRTRLLLRGAYTVPLGVLGRVGDAVAGRKAAHQSLASFVEQVARRLDAEADRRMESISYHPAPYHVDLREVGPESDAG